MFGEALFLTGDLEQLQQDFTKYAANFKKFFIATVADGVLTEEKHVAHGGRKKNQSHVTTYWWDEIKTLFDHVVMVVDGDTFDDALSKEADRTPQQTNQATINPLWGRHFLAERQVEVNKQTDRCVWTYQSVVLVALLLTLNIFHTFVLVFLLLTLHM